MTNRNNHLAPLLSVLALLASCTSCLQTTWAQDAAALISFNHFYQLTADDGTDTTVTDTLSNLVGGADLDLPFASISLFGLSSVDATGGAIAIDPSTVQVSAHKVNATIDVEFQIPMAVTAGQSSEIHFFYTIATTLGMNDASLNLTGATATGSGSVAVTQSIEDDFGFFVLNGSSSSPNDHTFLSASDQAFVLADVKLSAPANGLLCDFDANGICDIDDMDLLYSEFGAATTNYDVNGSGATENGDIAAWLTGASDPSNTYLGGTKTFQLGDVDLDGSVNSVDLGILLNNFGDTSGLFFGDGNLNDDPNVNSVDLGILLNNFGFTSAAAVAVPEPAVEWWFVLTCGLWFLKIRKTWVAS